MINGKYSYYYFSFFRLALKLTVIAYKIFINLFLVKIHKIVTFFFIYFTTKKKIYYMKALIISFYSNNKKR